MSPCIYSIRHESGAEYIGSTINLKRRTKENIGALRNGKHKSPALQAAWNSSTEDNWEIIILEECLESDLVGREQHHLDTSLSLLNYLKKADRNWLGREWPDDFRKKCSERVRQMNAQGRFGRQAWSDTTSKKHSDLMRKYTSEGRIGTSAWSDETKAKASASQKARMSTPEAKETQSNNAKTLHAEGRLGAKTWKPGEREKRAERMRQLHREGRVGPKSHKAYQEKHGV